jgi:superfamily II DNA or RNA helicase
MLRPYQQTLLQALIDASAAHQAVVAYSPTGSGKTETGMELVNHLSSIGRRVMWLANRIELIDQTSRRFSAHGLDHGVVQADHISTAIWKPLQIGSIQTVIRRNELRLPLFDAIIIDEAHGAVSPSYRKVVEAARAKGHPIYGLTATPFSKGLGTVFDHLVCGPSVQDLTDMGWLVPAKYYAPDRPDLKGVRTTAGDYNEGDLAQRVDTSKLVGNIVEEWLARASGLRTVVFATTIEHSLHITEQFRFRGIAAEHIDAYTDDADRKAVLARLRSGETKVVSNCAILAEGFDLPDLHCMVLARPTKSLIRYLQMVGRVLRPAPGKDHALVLDHSATVEELGFATDELPLLLDDGKPKKKVERATKPHICPKCKAVSARKSYPCKSCGFMPEARVDWDGEHADGTLREMAQRKEKFSYEQKQEIWSSYLRIARDRGYKQGWAAYRYKDMVGVWPRGLRDIPAAEVSMLVLNRQKYEAIKRAKSHRNSYDDKALGLALGAQL